MGKEPENTVGQDQLGGFSEIWWGFSYSKAGEKEAPKPGPFPKNGRW